MNYCMIFVIGVALGVIIGAIAVFIRIKSVGSMRINETEASEGLFSIRFSVDPMNVKDGRWIRLKIIRR